MGMDAVEIESAPIPLVVRSLADPQQNAQVGTHLGQEGGISLGVKSDVARGPVQTLEMVHEHRTFDLIDDCRECERVRFSLAGEGTDNDKSAGSVVALIGNHKGGAAFSLLASSLGIEVEPNDVSRSRNIRVHHSTFSLPRSGPVCISS